MKTLKYIATLFVGLILLANCTDDDMDYTIQIDDPSNLSALITISQDNSGLVTIFPTADGVSTYSIDYGDGSEILADISPGNYGNHIYQEGTYDVIITAMGLNGTEISITITIVVSFRAPENLIVTIVNDPAISKQVNVTATADFAMSFEVYFGEDPDAEPTLANIGETASYNYLEAGIYTIRVVAMGGAEETTEYSEEFEVTEILNPLVSAPEQPSRQPADYIAIYSDDYIVVPDTDFNPDWGQGTSFTEFVLDGDNMIQYGNISYQGIDLGENINASLQEFLHIDIWTGNVTSIDIYPLPDGIAPDDEKFVTKELVADQWNSFDIPVSDFTDQGLSLADLKQFKFVGAPSGEGTVFIDNFYFHKESSTIPTGIIGTWKLASEAGALGVGPSAGDVSWWNCDDACVADRACYYDDEYIFGSDGSFTNVLGSDTWIEGWQGGGEACGTPVAPHDGSNSATYSYDENVGTVILNGTGAFIGLAKAYNGGELTSPGDAPSSITYSVSLSNNDTVMNVTIETAAGTFWSFKLVKDGVVAPPPLAGTWKVASEAGALGVGPGLGDVSWWNCDDACVGDRACYYDDTYIFGSDGSFTNVLGADTWVEAWQGGADACGTPVAPHDGSASATYTFDEGAGTITLNGIGAFIGLPKAYNGGELTSPGDAPASITYGVTIVDDNTILVGIETAAGTFWNFKLIREGSGGGGGGGGTYNLTLPIDFENTGFGASWTWNVFENDTNPPLEFVANPNASGINTSSSVAKITALQAGQPWVGAETQHGEMGITWDLSASNAVIRIMVYKTVISDVGIKLVNPTGGAQEEIKVSNTVINQWEELTFDFSGRIGNGLDGSTNIDQIVVFPDFDLGGRTSDNVVYFDNITFGN